MVKEDNGNKHKESQIIEHGDIFFFYRPKVGTEEVEDIGDVQRFYMVISPEDDYGSNSSGRKGEKTKKNNNNNEGIYRLFLVGQKQLPEIVEGKSTSKERNSLIDEFAKEHNTIVEEEDRHLVTEAIKIARDGRMQLDLKYDVSKNYNGPTQIYSDSEGKKRTVTTASQIMDNTFEIYKLLLNEKIERNKPKTVDELYNVVMALEKRVKLLEEKT